MVLMANSLVEGPIPLAGAGFVAKPNGDFQPGEYKRLCNAEIDPSGIIKNRRNVYSVHGESSGTAVDPIVNPQRFMGSMGEYSFLTDGVDQYIVGNGTSVKGWNVFSGPTVAPSYTRFLGVFRYNNKNYWLVLEFSSGNSIALALYYDAAIPVPDIPATYGAGYQASLTREVILSFAAGTTDFYQFQYKNFFLYKERLWIATSIGLYFSAATDPTNFVVPNGGFFKFPGNVINWGFAIKDSVYVLCEDSVHAMTYSTDPNLDSTVRPLSDTIGGEMGCVHLDTPYFINNLGIFAISGNNVEKVMDSRFDYGKDYYRNRLFSFEEYLVVNKYSPINYDNNYSPPTQVNLRNNHWLSPESDTVGGTQIDDGWTTADSFFMERVRINKITNPSLELNMDAWTKPDIFDNTIVMTQDAAHFLYGTKSGAVNYGSAGGSPTVPLGVRLTRLVSENTTYTFSVYVRCPAAKTVRLTLTGLFDPINVTVDTAVSANTWTRISATITMPTGENFVVAQIKYLNVTDTSKYKWDGALLEQTNNLNPYFDGDTADDTFNNYVWDGSPHTWESYVNVETCVVNAIGTVADGQPGKVLNFSGAVPDLDDFYGKYVPGTSWATAIYTLSPTSALSFGEPYTFRFDHRGLGTWANAKFTLKVEFLDITGLNVLGTSNFTINNAYAPAGSYTTSTFEMTLPANTGKIQFIFKFALDPVSAGSKTFNIYMNRFHFEKSSSFSGYFTGATTDTPDVVYSWSGVAYASESTTGSATTHSYLKNNGSKFEPFQEGNSLGYNTYFINTDNGAVHVLDFMDRYEEFNHGGAGFVVDALVNPFSDNSGNYKMMLLTNKAISESESGHTYHGNIYFMASSEDIEIHDYAVDDTSTLVRRAPKIDIEIDSYVPDGLEYRIKKFRSLLFQGVIPPSGIDLQIAYDNSNVFQTVSLGDNESVLAQPRRHYAHRVGLNQRAKSITLRLLNLLWNDPIIDSYGELEFSDMRVMWTPTQKLSSTKNIGS